MPVLIHDRVMYAAWADELEKLAAPRWKQVLRAGGLGAEDVGRLLKGRVLDYGKEISGLERGTEAIAKKHGYTIRRANLGELKSGVKELIQKRDPTRLKQTARTGILGAQGGGGLAVGELSGPTAYMATGLSPVTKGLKGEARRGAEALLTRHEIDELRVAERAARKGPLPERRFVPGRAPETLGERASVTSLDAQRRLLDLAQKHAPRFKQGLRESVEGAVQAGTSGLPARRGVLPTGMHFSPDVVARESRNVATLPPAVQQAMTPFRRGEVQTMKGFRYGQEMDPRARRQVLKSFARGEI